MSDALPSQMTAFLNFCRIEKGLSDNSLQAYRADLTRFFGFLKESEASDAASRTSSSCARTSIGCKPRDSATARSRGT